MDNPETLATLGTHWVFLS